MRVRRISYPLIMALLCLFALLFVTPLYMTIVTALKEPSQIQLESAWQFPSRPFFRSFATALSVLRANARNSIILTVSATLLSALLGSINGYIFAKHKFKGSDLIFTLFLFGMFIPYQIILIPLFRLLRSIGLYGSIGGLILAHVVYGIPIVTLIFRNFYENIPDSIVESAYLDGAGFWNLYRRLFIPLSAPAFVVVVIWQITQIWNEFLWGVTLTRQDTQPLTVGLAQLAGGQAVSWNLPMAGSLIAALPVLLMFIFLGRFFVRGLLAGSVKE